MKWISIAAGVVFVLGLVMVHEGEVASSMKAENREGLILYGLLFCAISCVWFAIHGFTAMLRMVSKQNPPDSGT